MVKYFEKKKLLAQSTGRLITHNRTYPDAICDVIMTEEFLFVLEDNFDGTSNVFFKIPIERIIDVKKYNSENNQEKSVNKEFTPSRWTSAILALSGFVLIPGKKKQQASVFLRIDYKNEDDKTDAIFFENCSNIIGMVKGFQKYRQKLQPMTNRL